MKFRILKICLLAASLLLTAVSCAPAASSPRSGKVIIKNVEIPVEVAVTVAEQERGLAGRDSLAAGSGMLFVVSTPGSPGFWMKGMKFPLDIIWISNSSVSEITPNVGAEKAGVTPVTYYPKEPVDYVLEVNAGFAEKNNIQVGDSVKIE